MNKLLLIFISSLFILINGSSLVNALSLGQVVSNTTGTMGLGTRFHLPQGEWTVAGFKSLNGGVRPVEVILIQSEGKNIKAIINIRYARDQGDTQGWDAVGGWKPYEHYDNNNCDDYENQRSNFHNTNIEKKKQSLILEGSCLAIFARNDLVKLNDVATDTSIIESFDIADDYVNRKGLIFPEALVVIGNTYFTVENQVHVNYMANPSFSNIISESRVPFKDSEWNANKIDNYDDKKNYMANAISIGRNVHNQIASNFKYGSTLDLRPYDQILLFKNLNTGTSTENNTAVNKLKKLKEMFDQGLITQKQYEAKSESILNNL